MSLALPLVKSLFSQLREFGLNRRDWHVEEPMHKEFAGLQLQHRIDRDYRFRANLSRMNHGGYGANSQFVSSRQV